MTQIAFDPNRAGVQELFFAAIHGCANDEEAAQAYADLLTAATMFAVSAGVSPEQVSKHARIAYEPAQLAVEEIAAIARKGRDAATGAQAAGPGGDDGPSGGEGGDG